MAREKKQETAARSMELLGGRRWMGVAAFVLVLFYFTPLLSQQATIQWDAVDVHYTSQRYFADRVTNGIWPQWTPYIFGGFPFLADPQVGAFYPLNWPFFAAGITPASIQGELALHGLIALCGAFLLLRRLTGHQAGSLVGAFSYALGGFFAGHASHVGMTQAAALMPWLLYVFDRALEERFVKWASAAALVAGGMMLAGHLQTAAYGLVGLALFAGWRVIERRELLGKAALGLVVTAALAAAVAAVMIVPGMELTAQSIRAGADYSKSSEGTLAVGALGTLIYADAVGSLSGNFRMGGDITQSYFYSGVLLLPLAALALRKRAGQALAALLVLVPVWYMLGPGAGLYRLSAVVPLLGQVRAPVHMWFVAALGLAVLAAWGVAEAEVKWKKGWLGVALVVVFAFDLCQFNSWNNPLLYGHASYDDVYGIGEKAMRFKVAKELAQPFRIHMGDRMALFGPLNSPLQAQVAATYGYNPLELAAWHDYKAAAVANHALLDGLAVVMEVSTKEERIVPNNSAIARAYFAPQVAEARTEEESKAMLAGLDPRWKSVVLGPHGAIEQDVDAKAESMLVDEGVVRVTYKAARPSLLRLADAWYPGWEARVGGKKLEVLRVNHALMGVVVPAGAGEVVFEYKPRRFRAAATVSGVALALLLAGLLWPQKREGAGDDGVGA